MSGKRSKRDIMTMLKTAGVYITFTAAGFFTVVLFTHPAAFTALPDGGIECVHTIMLICTFGLVLGGQK